MAKDQEVRDSIIEAATKLYQKWGLKKTTMEDIAEEAGKGKATLYYYFANKNEVFFSVLQKQILEIQWVITQRLESVESSSEKLRQYILGMLEEAEKKMNFFSFMRMDIKGDKGLLYNLREMFEEYDHQMLLNIIENGISHKEFIELDGESKFVIASTISTSMRDIIVKQLFEDEKPFDMNKISVICDFFIRGLLVR